MTMAGNSCPVRHAGVAECESDGEKSGELDRLEVTDGEPDRAENDRCRAPIRSSERRQQEAAEEQLFDQRCHRPRS